jgi:hypothetical protein
MKSEVVIAGVVALIVVGAIVYLIKSTSGSSIGKNAAGVVTGFVGGIGSGVATVANDPNVNPLYGVGSSIGATIFDWTHPSGGNLITAQ